VPRLKDLKVRLWELRYRLTHSTFRTAWMAERAMLLADPRRLRDPILVYQMGRVGSSAAIESLRARYPGIGLYQPHWLSPEGLDRFEALNRESFTTLRFPLALLVRSRFLQDQIARRAGFPWRIITAVRDPVARNLSWFFTEMQWRHRDGNPLALYRSGEREAALRELQRLFEEDFEQEAPVQWFDRELKATFGLDVLAHEFDPARGYQIYQDGGTRVLLYRLESLGECGEGAFAEFLGVDSFTLLRTNSIQDKSYGEIHQAFVSRVRLHDDVLDRLYDSPVMRHFYTPAEIDRFRGKWRPERVLATAVTAAH